MNNNKKIHIKNIIVLIVIIILIAVGIALTMSRYRSQGQTTLNADVAFFVVKDTYYGDDTTEDAYDPTYQEANIFLEDLYPSEEKFTYTFTVANTNGTQRAETNIDYTAEMVVTTNLPLEFTIYKNDNELTDETTEIENNVVFDSTEETYIRKIKIKNGYLPYSTDTTDVYRVEVEFPIEYITYEEFEGMIDIINIRLEAEQKIS